VSEAKAQRIVFFGRQGAGKGTQCFRLAAHLGIPHVSTGDMFREAIRSKSDLGQQVEAVIAAGHLVTDELTQAIVRERLTQPDALNGFLLDGFPRTTVQAEWLLGFLKEHSWRLDLAIDLDVPEEIVLERLSSRRVCENCGAVYSTSKPPTNPWTCDVCGGNVVQRADDSEDAIRKRLALYTEQTSPLLAWCERHGILKRVDGIGSPDDVFNRILTTL
jgi:adenylate kinase